MTRQQLLPRLLVWAILLLGAVLAGCATAPARVAAPAAWMIPAHIRDTDRICIPHNGGGLCMTAGAVRRLIASREVAP